MQAPTAAFRVGIVGAGRIGASLRDLLVESGVDAAAVDAGDPWDTLAGRTIIIESLPEDLGVKRNVIAEVQQRLVPTAVLSTTSSLTAAALGHQMPAPDRVLVWHPFNPVQRRRLVEIATASSAVGDGAVEARRAAEWLAEVTGREVLRVKDSPGLVVNRILKRWTHAGLAALEDGWSSDAVDAAFVAAGFRRGPVAVVRLVDPAVSLAVSRSLAQGLGARFDPPQVLIAAAQDARALQRPGRDGDAMALVASALSEVRDEIDLILAEELVAGGLTDVRRALSSGAGWPDAVLDVALDDLHSW